MDCISVSIQRPYLVQGELPPSHVINHGIATTGRTDIVSYHFPAGYYKDLKTSYLLYMNSAIPSIHLNPKYGILLYF